jgi:hypothetical protein
MEESGGCRESIETLKAYSVNQNCADCRLQPSTFVSVSHGTFICRQCAVSHMLLGTVDSQVKEISSEWTPEQVAFIANGGNDAIQQLFQYYEILDTPVNYKYNTKAAAYYRRLMAKIAEQLVLKEELPTKLEGKKIDVDGEKLGVIGEEGLRKRENEKGILDRIDETIDEAADKFVDVVERMSEKISSYFSGPAWFSH